MGRLRYIEPELWSNPELRRLGHLDRLVFVYLFSSLADDEGRFRWEPRAILEGMFNREAQETENDLSSSLKRLQAAGKSNGRPGMVLRYGPRGSYGFLTGWFEHQSMHKNVRQESALPRPPVEVATWRDADEVRSRYGEYAEKKAHDCSYKQAIRWYAQSRAKGPEMPTSDFSVPATYRLRPEGKEKGNFSFPPSPPTAGEHRASADCCGAVSPTTERPGPSNPEKVCAILKAETVPPEWEYQIEGWARDYGPENLQEVIDVEYARVALSHRHKTHGTLAAHLVSRLQSARKVNGKR